MFFAKSVFSNKAEEVIIFEPFWSPKSVEHHYKLLSKNVFQNFFGFLQNFGDFRLILRPQNTPRNHLKIDFGNLQRRSGINFNLVLQGPIWVDSGWFGLDFSQNWGLF